MGIKRLSKLSTVLLGDGADDQNRWRESLLFRCLRENPPKHSQRLGNLTSLSSESRSALRLHLFSGDAEPPPPGAPEGQDTE